MKCPQLLIAVQCRKNDATLAQDNQVLKNAFHTPPDFFGRPFEFQIVPDQNVSPTFRIRLPKPSITLRLCCLCTGLSNSAGACTQLSSTRYFYTIRISPKLLVDLLGINRLPFEP